MLDVFELTLCDMQGKLFEMSANEGFSSEAFIKTFMLSNTAADLDKLFNHMQWAGQGYIIDRLREQNADTLETDGELYDNETLYWSGYLYRYWHIYTGETSKEIYKQAPAKTMRAVYLMYHTMSPEMAIDRLKDTYARKHK
ncbi:MAG: hypothetical protein IJY82_01340 [Oscillospiraceae bacterium]|nr:hypothetical protein [Oscillospiraceae bacterium]